MFLSGPVVPLMNVRITDEGEIQAKGPGMAQGHWNKPELNKEPFAADGWIRTGDIGEIDREGYVTITDRLKDMFKTSGGKYVAPQQIESLLKDDIYFDQVAAVGGNKKFVPALIVPSFENLAVCREKNGIACGSREELVKNPWTEKIF